MINAKLLAAEIASESEAVGAIVIVLDSKGSIDIGMATSEDQEASAPLINICKVLATHCEANHKRLPDEESEKN